MCGIVGVHAPGQEAGRLASLALFALQHRGQESAGVAVSDGEGVMVYKDLGLVAQVLDERRLAVAAWRPGDRPLSLLDDRLHALGEQPADVPPGAAADGRDGPQRQPRQHPRAARAAARRPDAPDRHDRHGAAHRAPRRRTRRGPRGGARARSCRASRAPTRWWSWTSAASSACATRYGFRPLVLGRLPASRSSVTPRPWATARRRPSSCRGRTARTREPAPSGWVLASETAALDILGADFVRDVEPGEMVVLGEPGGPRSVRFAEGASTCACSS